jgi:5,10-methylenetetrahydromethanopterin reductase
MRFSVMIWPHSEATIDPVVRLAKVADDEGYDTFYVGDSQMIWNDVWVTLAACAVATKRVKLAPGVTNIVTRHPVVTVNAITSLNMLSDGRAVLGIAAGDSALRTAGLSPVRLAYLNERLARMKALLRGEETETMEWYDPRGEKAWGVESRMRVIGAEQWGSKIPIEWAVLLPKSAEVAAEQSDGVIIVGNLGGTEEGRRVTMERVASGAEKGGRDPKDVRVIFSCDAAIDDDREKAFQQVRETAARVVANVGWLPDEIAVEHADTLKALKEHYQFYEHLDVTADHRELIPDELASKVCIVGTPEDCIKKCRELKEGGVTDIAIFGTSQDEDATRVKLERFAREVMPHV